MVVDRQTNIKARMKSEFAHSARRAVSRPGRYRKSLLYKMLCMAAKSKTRATKAP